MVEEIAFENGRISNFQRLVTLTLTLEHCLEWIMLVTLAYSTANSIV